MAVVENVGFNITSLNPTVPNDSDIAQSNSKQNNWHNNGNPTLGSDNLMMVNHQKVTIPSTAQAKSNSKKNVQMPFITPHSINLQTNGDNGGGDREGFKKEMRDLEEMLSKLNPLAEEYVPRPTVAVPLVAHFGYTPNNFVTQTNGGSAKGITTTKRKKNNHGKRKMNNRTNMAQQEDVIKRTVYVSDIDQQVTEEQLAALFVTCGQVVDCRICGDPNSVLRFAFIEFTDEDGARNALTLAGTMLGFYPVRVLPSKTAIAPVNPTYLPRSEDEREMCSRTIYCTNIDKKITQADVKIFFESFCGEVHRLRLLGDYHHSTRVAFVEFVMAESAIMALNCSGAILGSSAIRVSPSKTPVRPRAPRPAMH